MLDKLLGSFGGGGILGFLGPIGLLTGIASLASGKKSIGEAARDAMLGGMAGKAFGIGSFGDIGQVMGTGSKGKAGVDAAKLSQASAGVANEASKKFLPTVGKGIMDRIKEDPMKAATQAATLYGIFGALGEKPEEQVFTAADMETNPDYKGQVYKGSMDPIRRKDTNPICGPRGLYPRTRNLYFRQY